MRVSFLERFLPSSDDDAVVRLASLGLDLDLDDLDAPLPFLDSLRATAALPLPLPPPASSTAAISSRTFCLNSRLSLLSDGTGESELVGVCVRDAFLDDFLVSGDCSMRCFHSSSRFIDSSLCSFLRPPPPFTLSSLFWYASGG